MRRLPKNFFLSTDVVSLARQLLGKKLLTNTDGHITGGLISETEAYNGLIDRASHAWPNKKTARTAVMFQPGGRTYVFFCYGVHHLLNIVTGSAETPHAILIRGIFPSDGVETMLARRNKRDRNGLTDGPGKVAQALGLTLLHNNLLLGDQIWIEETGISVTDTEILATPRVGIDYAGADKDLPWRFVWTKKAG